MIYTWKHLPESDFVTINLVQTELSHFRCVVINIAMWIMWIFSSLQQQKYYCSSGRVTEQILQK